MSETIAQTLARLTAFIQSSAPTLDLSPGSVFSELILGLESQIQNQVYNDIDAISTEQAISQVINSLTPTYSSIIDQIASNYNVTRIQGAAAAGNIKVFTSAQNANTYVLPSGTSFTQPALGYTYQTTSPITLNSGSFILQNGLYYFIIPVYATTIGIQTAVSNLAPFILNATSAIPNYVNSVAYGTFSQGINQETDQQLITRFRTGLATTNLLTAASINNQLTQLYPSFRGAYLADTTSPVNIRSQNNLLNIKVPGCVDVYVKNDITIPQTSFQIVGSYDSINAVWDVTIPATQAPGFYRIVNVQDAAATNLAYLPFTVTYGYDNTTPSQITTPAQARYSIYQTATLAITYVPPVMSQPFTFNITAIAPFNLSPTQALFLNNNNRIPCTDYLAKGIIPCNVSMSISIVRNNVTDVINVSAIQSAIFNYVNSLPIGSSVAVSQIVSICHQFNIARVDLPILLNGQILAPYDANQNATDENIIIEGNDFLEIPTTLTQYGVSPANTMFFLSYYNDSGTQNINITVK
jgi:hypothetical protein